MFVMSGETLLPPPIIAPHPWRLNPSELMHRCNEISLYAVLVLEHGDVLIGGPREKTVIEYQIVAVVGDKHIVPLLTANRQAGGEAVPESNVPDHNIVRLKVQNVRQSVGELRTAQGDTIAQGCLSSNGRASTHSG
jgi:hypothetical protein